MIRRILVLATCVAAAAFGQAPVSMILGEETTKISDHVWTIRGNPNIGIIIGERATLVVDTGLGTKNGETIARVVAKLSKNPKIFLTTTHFHPEHAGGEPGFPAGTILIRNTIQQQEMETNGMQMIQMFAGMNPTNAGLLAGVKLRTPDVLFDSEAKIDLGGVTARLLWFGGAHTKGDELTFVEPDRTLISGDVVQNKVVPNIFGDGGTPASWLAVLDKVSALNALHVLPDHSAPGDGSLVMAERSFIADLRNRALELKNSGLSAADAGTRIGTEFKSKYADWPNMNVNGFVQSVYAEK